MKDVRNLKAYDLPALRTLVQSWGEPVYRADQIFRWIWKRGETDIAAFSDLPRALRERLVREGYTVSALERREALHSRDGTVKFLFRTASGHEVETVWIPDGSRRTVCVSSQVGCALKCTFCATGLLGFKANLPAHEIVDQVLQASLYMGERVTNVVLMGMGEPLLNWEAVRTAMHMMNRDLGLALGARRITLSTVGIPDRVRAFASPGKQFRLAWSLHAAIQEKRERIIPLARTYPLTELLEAFWAYYRTHRRWVTLEYLHLPGFNDTREDVEALRRLVRKLPSKVNVIPFNPSPGLPFRAPEEAETQAFVERLRRVLPHPVTYRVPRGRDIFGACGQLALQRPLMSDAH